MYTLMKSEQRKLKGGARELQRYEQKKVAQYADFDDAVTACDEANRERADWHYVMNELGKEFYDGSWID